MFCYKKLSEVVFLLVFFRLTLQKTAGFESFINVTVFPVGEGEATIIECSERPDNVSITLINAGSMHLRKGEIELEYLEFVEKKLNSSHHTIRNIILTSSETKHYNFIEPLMNFLKKEDVRPISFYVGGERSSYTSLEHVFQSSDKVYEFSRLHEVDNSVGSCGHMDANNIFLDCIKRCSRGPITNSNQVISICEHFQINVLAANYGFSDRATTQRARTDDKSGLILKITPSECSSPSFLLGEIGHELEGKANGRRKHNEFIKNAHSHYLTRSSKIPQSLWEGLRSTLVIAPMNVGPNTSTKDAEFYNTLVQPQYGIISSDISIPLGHPRCSVLRSLDKCVSKYSTKKKILQCHRQTVKNLKDIETVKLSDNLYQTSVVTFDDHLQPQVSFKRIQFTMTKTELSKPVEWLAKRKKQYNLEFHEINKLLANTRDLKKRITVQYIVEQLGNRKLGRCNESTLEGIRDKKCHSNGNLTAAKDKKNLNEIHGEKKSYPIGSRRLGLDSYPDISVDDYVRTDRMRHRRNQYNDKSARELYQQDSILPAYKKDLIAGPKQNDYVDGLNDVANQQRLMGSTTTNMRYEEDLGGHLNTLASEYWEDLNNHSEPNSLEGVDENNLMYNYNENSEAPKHQDNDLLNMRYNNIKNNKLDEVTIQMQRYNEYPSYHAATEIHTNYPNNPTQSQNQHNRKIKQQDDFNYFEGNIDNSYERNREPTTPHKLKEERDREDYAFVHGVDYNTKKNNYNNKNKEVNQNKDSKYLEDDFVSSYSEKAIPQRYESVSNEYRLPNEASDITKDHDKTAFQYLRPTGGIFESKQHMNTASATPVSEELTQGRMAKPSDKAGRSDDHEIGTNQEELENPSKPTYRSHNQGEIGELGDDHKLSTGTPFHHAHQHTTIKAAINYLVKELASMNTWSTRSSESPLSPYFKHYRKGIPTPHFRKKSHHTQQQRYSMTSLPTKSFTKSMDRKKTTHNLHKPTRQHLSTKHHTTISKLSKTTKHHRLIGHQKTLRDGKNKQDKNTTKKQKTLTDVKSTKQGISIDSRRPSKHSSTRNSSTRMNPNESKNPPKSLQTDTSPIEWVSEAEKPSLLINKLNSGTTLPVPLHDPRVINILCFGDSLTAGYNKRGKDFFPYCSVLKDMLISQTDIPVNVDIKGIVGEMTHKQMSYRLPLVLGNATSQYDWIIILGGTNDILHVKNFADDQYFLSQLENVWQPRITKDIEKLHLIANKYDARTLMLTVPENSIESWPEYRLLRKMRVKINEALRDFAATSQGRTVFCDTAKIVPRKSLSSAEESFLWDDHVHMTRDGYVRMARAVAQCLLPYLPKKNIFRGQ